MKIYKVAIIGCGRIFDKHIKAINSLNSYFRIESVCDINKKKTNNYKNKYKIYENIEDLILNSSADIAVILTPSGLHFDHIKLLSHKFINIVVEKPMCMNFDQGKQIVALVKLKKINLFVVKQNRFNPAIIQLKKAIKQNRFGKIFLATIRVRWSRKNEYFMMDKWRGTWKNDGGVLANQASHHIDLLQWLIGDVESVVAKTSKIVKKTKADDTCVGLINFKKGTLGIIEATTATQPKDLEGSISILGKKGSVVIGGFAVSRIDQWSFIKKKKIDNSIKNFSNNNKNVYGFGHKSFYKDVYLSLKKKSQKKGIRATDGIKSIILIDKLYASAELNKEILIKDKNYSAKLGK